MTKPPSVDVTQLLLDWSNGDPAALNKLTRPAYAELRRLTYSYLRRERFDHTLQDTELVHEAYMRLAPHRLDREPSRFIRRGKILKGKERCISPTVIEKSCKQ